MPNRLARRRAAAIARKQPTVEARRMPQLPRAIQCRAQVTIAAADKSSADAPRTFSIVAYTGEPMSIWPFDLPVVIDLSSVDVSQQHIPALYDHMPYVDTIVGQVESLSVTDGRLVASGRFTVDQNLPPDRNFAQQVLARADAGYRWQASVGGTPSKLDEIKGGETAKVNGRDYAGPCYIARGVSLREISFVVLGGDRRTSAVVARHRHRPSTIRGSAMVPTFEEWVASLGFSEPELNDQQRAAMRIAYGELYGDDAGDAATTGNDTVTAADGEDTVTAADGEDDIPPSNARARRPAIRGGANVAAQMRAEAATERQRQVRLGELCAAAGNPQINLGTAAAPRTVDLLAHAIAQGWDSQRTELEILRTSRPAAPNVIARSHDRDCTLQAMQGAMLLRASARLDHVAFNSSQAVAMRVPTWLRAGINDANRNQIMEAAHRYASMSMVDLCREAIRIDGRDCPHDRDEMIRAAFSGGSLTNIFTTNVNAQLLIGYLEAPDSTIGWVTEADVNDFKTQERPRVEVGPGLAKLPRGGSADHAAYEDAAESYRIARYAKQLQVDEQDIIDDSFGALSDTPLRFGQAARRLKPDLVYSILLANGTLTSTSRALFNTTDGNLLTTAALAADKLRAAIKAFTLIRENGVNLNITPTHLLVPPALIDLAFELVKSPYIVLAGTAGSVTERGQMNSLARYGITPVTDARLENGVTDPSSETAYAGSATSWYMASTMAHTIEVGYLRGTGRAPKVRTWVMDRGSYGIGWDVAMDIGAKALDWKGLQKNTA